MTVEHVELLVEEPSMEAALRLLVPRIIGQLSFEVYSHQSKSQFLARLPARLTGYHRRAQNDAWFRDCCRIVVLIDRDGQDCRRLKKGLERLAADAGLTTRSVPRGGRYTLVNRLAIEELEAWYFGDWNAVMAAYPRVPASIPKQAKYRDPDAIAGGTWETFEAILQRAGYFPNGLRKVELARTIAASMNPGSNSSTSFRRFREALEEIAELAA